MTTLEAITGAVLAAAIGYVGAYATHTYRTTDTSDWFDPETALLEVRDGGTLDDQTYNPQLTIDGSQLQNTVDASEFDYRHSIDNIDELSTTAELQGGEL